MEGADGREGLTRGSEANPSRVLRPSIRDTQEDVTRLHTLLRFLLRVCDVMHTNKGGGGLNGFCPRFTFSNDSWKH